MQEPYSIRKGASAIAFQSIQYGQLQDFRKIGSGGFGIVYKAKHQTLGDVAVKKCRLNSQTEVDGLAKPGTNNFIVRIFGWIKPTKTDFNSYIVMEYMEYGSLKEFSRKLMPFPDSLKIKMISEVIKGMNFLHNKDIIHRDLKLDNIFVGKEFSVKIGDLGLATWESVLDPSKSTPGTVTHMAPELLNDINEPASKESDVYSFGITLWELSTREDPFEHALNSEHIKMCVCNNGGQRPSMKDFAEDVPHIIKDMMERAWHQTPAKRPTFQVLKEEVEKEYAANYEKDFSSDLLKVYGQPFLAQRREEESCKQSCTPPWSRARDITDSSEKKPDTGKDGLPGVNKAMTILNINERQNSPSSSDSESDVKDPKVLEIMKSKEILNEKHIRNSSKYIGSNWKDLGRELELENGKLQNIQYDNHGDQREMAYQVMLAWKRKQGRATKGQLATALVAVELSEVALKLK